MYIILESHTRGRQNLLSPLRTAGVDFYPNAEYIKLSIITAWNELFSYCYYCTRLNMQDSYFPKQFSFRNWTINTDWFHQDGGQHGRRNSESNVSKL